MLQVGNTLYVTEPGLTLRLNRKALCIEHEDGSTDSIPLHLLEKILAFSPKTVTVPLMSYCAEQGVGLSCLGRNGRLKFRVEGETRGNVLTRRRQYSMDEEERLLAARPMIVRKLAGQAENLSRFVRNHPEKATGEMLRAESEIRGMEERAATASGRNALRGIEGCAANAYFSVFDRLILSPQAEFSFAGRAGHPPADRCNALLSFAYTLLAYDCAAAADSFGIDPYMGVLHGERPGKPAMALDLMEEFRPVMADRFVCRLVNLGMIKAEMFERGQDDGVRLTAEGRGIFLREWSRMKQKEHFIEMLGRNGPCGLRIYLRAQEFAAYLRGEAGPETSFRQEDEA